MRKTTFVFASTLAFVSVSAIRDAAACGGCFHEQAPPTEADASTTQSGTVVTDHRMALAITSQGTTLWDQIEYAGDPGKFVWVLPIQGAVTVATGSDAFLEALDQRTTPQIIGPTVFCNSPPPPPSSGGGGGGFTGGNSSGTMGCGCGASADDVAAAGDFSPKDTGVSTAEDGGIAIEPDEGVVVTHRDTVGPYETVQITGDGGDSILTWLRKNGYEVPAAVEPMVQKYVDEKFGFLAVKLSPNAGVQAMKPIRVSWKGKTPQLPLRMVAAGVGASVGLKLFVIGDGRWTTKNFQSFTVADDSLVWNFETSRSNYTEQRAAKAKELLDRAWALEASIDVNGADLPAGDPEPIIDGGAAEAATEAATDVDTDATDSTSDASDGAPDSVVADGDLPDIPASENDREVAFFDGSPKRVTRLRADLPARYLDVDLELEADEDQSVRPTDYHAAKYLHAEQLCTYGVASVVPKSFDVTTAAPAQESKPEAAACAVGDEKRPFSVSLLGLGALAALGLVRRFKR